ncbi:hypothetical protein E2562_016438 [Oryza meyeriana var. granulata]|uniref:Uncharacterized protein n=1 Tax=Oryza meyeriana var. granulata TaxID=110450 RepID=A0A6G1EXA2_9ORYZ|nr:hypothetical protein E2562_016438 [Oryza meyeriana var. granulata]
MWPATGTHPPLLPLIASKNRAWRTPSYFRPPLTPPSSPSAAPSSTASFSGKIPVAPVTKIACEPASEKT